jgi:cyclophilin family peptidyl-prolyl cis-trans isomerase
MDNHDGADQELVEKGKSGPSEKSPQAQINGTMAEPWWKQKIAGRVPVWSIGLIGVVVVIAAVIGIATSLSAGAKKPKLKITDKVTFEIGNEDGDTLGEITIGVFGDILSKTRKNFISLAKKEVDGEEIDYGYLGSRFSNEEDYVITAGIFGGNEKGKAIYDAGEHGNFYFSGKFEDFVWEDLTKYNKENLTSCCLREGYVAMLKNPDTEGDDWQAAFDSQFVIYKEDITWDDGDLKQNLIFGKVIDEESSKGILEKLNGPGRLIIKNVKDIKENIEESIDKPKTLELTN